MRSSAQVARRAMWNTCYAAMPRKIIETELGKPASGLAIFDWIIGPHLTRLAQTLWNHPKGVSRPQHNKQQWQQKQQATKTKTTTTTTTNSREVRGVGLNFVYWMLMKCLICRIRGIWIIYMYIELCCDLVLRVVYAASIAEMKYPQKTIHDFCCPSASMTAFG